MKCEEMLKSLSEYVDGEIDPAICEQFEQHLAGCDPCRVVIDNIRQTITLYQGDEPYPVPEEFQQRLHHLMRRRWQEKFGAQSVVETSGN